MLDNLAAIDQNDASAPAHDDASVLAGPALSSRGGADPVQPAQAIQLVSREFDPQYSVSANVTVTSVVDTLPVPRNTPASVGLSYVAIDIPALREELRSDLQALTAELRVGIRAFLDEIHGDLQSLTADLKRWNDGAVDAG